MDKTLFEMVDAEAEITNILRNLEYSAYRLTNGFSGGNNNLSVEEVNRLSEDAAEKIMDAFEQVYKLLEEYKEPDVLERDKNMVIYEHECFEAADFRAMQGYTMVNVEDSHTEEGEEATLFTFKNEEGTYISLSYLDGVLSMSEPYIR